MSMNARKRVLLIGGTGTLGGSTYPELLRLGYDVDAVSLEDFSSVSPRLRFLKGRADLSFLERLFKEIPRYSAIIDFIHTPDIAALKSRISLLLEHTDQFVFLSSYRTYSDCDGVVTESTPQWLDVTKDEEFLSRDDYEIPKAKGERILSASGKRNWTVIRPLIAFTHYRLDLVTVGAYALLFRPKNGRPVVLPVECRHKTAGVGWGGNTGREIAHLVGKDSALCEAFTLGTPETITWGDVASYYEEFLGARFEWVPVEDYLEYATPNTYMHRQMIYTDRMLDRKVDLSKMLRVTGLDSASFKNCRDAVAHELAFLSERPDLVARFDTSEARLVDERTDLYLKRRPKA